MFVAFDAVASAVPSAVPPVFDIPVIIDGLMFFTDGTVMQFTDDTVIYFGE